jgi:hypothetical protein
MALPSGFQSLQPSGWRSPGPLGHRARREIFPFQGFLETILRGAAAGLLSVERPDSGPETGALPPFRETLVSLTRGMDPKGTTGTASPETIGEEWSGRRDSNPRPTAWKAVTLPLSYSREQASEQAPANRTTANEENGGGGRIRTSVGRSPADLQSAAIVHSATPPKNRATLDRGLEPAPGFEPGTYGLQDRSSTPELCRRVGTQAQETSRTLPNPGAG